MGIQHNHREATVTNKYLALSAKISGSQRRAHDTCIVHIAVSKKASLGIEQ